MENEDEFFLPMIGLDDRLLLNRGKNRKLLTAEWQRLTGKKGKEFNIICAELTAYEYKLLFNTDKVTVVPKEAKETEKELLNRAQTVLVAQLEESQLNELEKEMGFLDKFSIKMRIRKIAKFVLKSRGKT
jgi:hypothetical protein